jgi:hypothetical protein
MLEFLAFSTFGTVIVFMSNRQPNPIKNKGLKRQEYEQVTTYVFYTAHDE